MNERDAYFYRWGLLLGFVFGVGTGMIASVIFVASV